MCQAWLAPRNTVMNKADVDPSSCSGRIYKEKQSAMGVRGRLRGVRGRGSEGEMDQKRDSLSWKVQGNETLW